MSQSNFLENLSRLSPDECRQSLDEAMPKIISQISKSSNRKIDAVKLLCELFVPVCPVHRLEEEVYAKIHDKIISISDGLYDELCTTISQTSEAAEELQNQLSSLLETSMDLIGCLELCVSALIQPDSASVAIEMEYIHSLSSIVLHVLQGSYTHCKDSNQIYGRFLGSLTGQLSALFKKTHALQMNFISVVDKISVSPSDADINDLCAILHGFYDISAVAVSLDVKVMIVMWKTISRLASQHKALLHNNLDLDPMLTSLTNDMASSFTYMMQMVTNGNQNDGKAFTKSVKVLGFQMKVLVALVKDYCHGLSSSVSGMVQLILSIQSYMPPGMRSSEISPAHRADFERQVAVAVEPLLSYLVPHAQFVSIMTEYKTASSFDQWVALYVTLVNVSQMLFNFAEEIQTMWLNPSPVSGRSRQSLLDAIFTALDKCYIELSLPASLPSIMCQGKPQKSVTLYEYTCTRLCGFIACLPSQYFKCVEKCLLLNVLSPNLHNVLLAADLWCFLVRYGSANLCRDHCLLLVKLLSKSQWTPTRQCCHLVLTLRRLLKFLAPEHQCEFLDLHPLTSSVPLYGILPVAVFSGDVQRTITQQLYRLCTERAKAWCDRAVTMTTAAAALELAQLYRALSNVCTSVDVGQHTDQSVRSNLVHHTYNCVLSLYTVTMEKYGRVIQTLASNAVNALAYQQAGNQLDNSQIQMLLEQFSTWLKSSNLSENVKISIVNFLASLGKKKFPVNAQQAQLLQTLPRLFSALLSQANPVVYQLTLETFAAFAEETVHETIVSESLQTGDDGTQTRVVTYLNKLANGVDITPSDMDQLRVEYELQQEQLQVQSVTNTHEAGSSTARREGTQPQLKRQKMETTLQVDPKVQEVLDSLRKNTTTLSSLLSTNGPIPSSITREIIHIKSQLEALTAPS